MQMGRHFKNIKVDGSVIIVHTLHNNKLNDRAHIRTDLWPLQFTDNRGPVLYIN